MQGINTTFPFQCYSIYHTFAATKYQKMQQLLLSLCIAATLGVTEARFPSDMGDHTVIIVIQGNKGSQIGNRGTEVVPISGYVDTDTGVVEFNFSRPCGMVNISFDNLSDGSNFDTTVNGDGTVIIPAMLSTGLWRLYFTLPNGLWYYVIAAD